MTFLCKLILKTFETKSSFYFLSSAHQLFALKALKIWLQFKPIFRFTKDFVLHKKHVVNGIFRIADEIISEKEKSFTESSESDQPQIFIDQLFKKREVFSFAEMRDEILTVIAAVSFIKTCSVIRFNGRFPGLRNHKYVNVVHGFADGNLSSFTRQDSCRVRRSF